MKNRWNLIVNIAEPLSLAMSSVILTSIEVNNNSTIVPLNKIQTKNFKNFYEPVLRMH